MDDVAIDTFIEKQIKRHREIRSEGISWASEEPAEYRFLGLNWVTWLVMAGIAGAGWIAGLPL